jgi:hypothetical protein
LSRCRWVVRAYVQIDDFHTTSIARLHAEIARLPSGWTQERLSDGRANAAAVFRSPRGRVCRSVIQAVHVARLELCEDAAAAEEAARGNSAGGDDDADEHARGRGGCDSHNDSDDDDDNDDGGRDDDDDDDDDDGNNDARAGRRRRATASPGLELQLVVDELVDVAATTDPKWLIVIVRELLAKEQAAVVKARTGDAAGGRAFAAAAQPPSNVLKTCRGMVRLLVAAAHKHEIGLREERARGATLSASSCAAASGAGGTLAKAVSHDVEAARLATERGDAHLKRIRHIFALLMHFCSVSEELLLQHLRDFTVFLDEDDVLGSGTQDEAAVVFHFVKIIGLCAERLVAAADASVDVTTQIMVRAVQRARQGAFSGARCGGVSGDSVVAVVFAVKREG